MLHAFSLPKLEHLGAAPITATSSYITIRGKWMYSAGGPTGEVHRLPFPEPVKEQQFLFVSEDELETADKTRVALRTGSHAIEFGEDDVATRAYVPVLGTDKVHIYLVDPAAGLLSEEKVLKTPEGSGPRHLKLHPNGQVLYVVTEHDNTLLTYSLPSLELLSTHTLYPPATSSSSPKAPADQASYRGDTLMLSPSATTLFTTTRGATPATRGWLAAFPLTSSGLPSPNSAEITYWLTPTSGGKANAIDVMLYPGEKDKVLLILTDDDPSSRAIIPPCDHIQPSLYVIDYTLPQSPSSRGSFSVVASITDSEIGGTSHAVFIPGLGTDGDAAEGRHDEL